MMRIMASRKDEHVSVQMHCNIHLSQRTCEPDGANLCCPRFETETTFVFCTVIQKRKNPPGPRPCEALEFRHDPQSRTTRVTEITSEEHEVYCRGGEIIAATHFPAEKSCRILVRTGGLCHVILCCRTVLSRGQVHRTSRAFSFQSCSCELMGVQPLYQQSLGTLRECFCSELASENMGVGRQASALDVPCDNAANFFSLTSCFHFLQSFETLSRSMLAPLWLVWYMARSVTH